MQKLSCLSNVSTKKENRRRNRNTTLKIKLFQDSPERKDKRLDIVSYTYLNSHMFVVIGYVQGLPFNLLILEVTNFCVTTLFLTKSTEN